MVLVSRDGREHLPTNNGRVSLDKRGLILEAEETGFFRQGFGKCPCQPVTCFWKEIY